MTPEEFDKYLLEFFSENKEELANLLFEPVPVLSKEEKEEIERYFASSPTWREREKKLFIAVGGEEYARKKGLLDE